MATKTRRITFSEDELSLMIEVLDADITERQGRRDELERAVRQAKVDAPLAESVLGGHNYRLRKRTELRTRLIDELGKAK